MTTVSFVVPVRNEEEHILACLQSLVAQDYPVEQLEILLVDGRSSDGTREIVEKVSRQCPHVRCLDNPAGIVPTGMNIGIRAARGEVIIRADGHNSYPPDYAANCVRYLEQTKADNVGGPLVTCPANGSFSARLVAGVLSSPFGVGNSKFRTTREEGFVDTVPFGAFPRAVFDRVGWYNEKLVRNQDNDLNARIRQAGGKIYQTPALTTYYHPLKNLWALLKHAFRANQWNFFTICENPGSLSLRHLAPPAFVAFLLLSLPLSLMSTIARAILLATMALYFLAGFYFAQRLKTRDSLALILLLPFACFCFHAAYGAGTLFGLRYLFREPEIKPIRPGASVQPSAK